MWKTFLFSYKPTMKKKPIKNSSEKCRALFCEGKKITNTRNHEPELLLARRNTAPVLKNEKFVPLQHIRVDYRAARSVRGPLNIRTSQSSNHWQMASKESRSPSRLRVRQSLSQSARSSNAKETLANCWRHQKTRRFHGASILKLIHC